MSSSDINVMFINQMEEKINLSRENVASGMTIEQIELGTLGHAFIEDLIKRRFERYNAKEHRHGVVCSDPIARFVCKRYAKEMTAKPFKSYEMDEEGQPEEIMADIWERWEQLNMNEPARAIYGKIASDGYCLFRIYITPSGSIGYRAYGFYESPPDYWKRINMRETKYHNVIFEYYVQFIPHPMGYEYMGNYNIHAEEEWLRPNDPDFFHFYRGEWNFGIGDPRLQGIWAALTKLRKISHADFRRSSIFNVFEYPEDWDPEKQVQPMIEALRRADEMEGVAFGKRINPMSSEVEDWPKFYDRTMDQIGAAPRADPSSGGTLLRNPEYARVLIDLGYTETKFVGNQPGAVEGSKLDYTENDEVDMREFGLFKPIIKQILQWLLMNGFLEGCDPESIERVAANNYDIKVHWEYEVMENRMREIMEAGQLAEQDAEAKAEYSTRENIAPFLLYNLEDNTSIIGYRTNINLPILPIEHPSKTISGAGVSGDRLVVRFKGYPPGGGLYFYDFQSEMAAMQAHEQLSQEGGKYVWRRIRGHEKGEEVTPYKMGPAYLTGRPTIGGTSASLVPYEIQMYGAGGVAAPKWGVQKKTKTPKTPATESTESFDTTLYSTYNPTASQQPSTISSTSWNPTIPARQPRNAAPNLRFLSFKRANSIMKEATGSGMSASTFVRIKDFLKKYQSENQLRVNSIDVGNPMNFDIPMKYIINGKEVHEYACKKDWKEIEPHEGPLWLYRNLGHSGERFNVGIYKYWWDEKKDQPQLYRDIKEDQIKKLLKKWGKESSIIMDRLNKSLPISMSTEYYCSFETHNGKKYQRHFHNENGELKFRGIAIVERGNCDEPFCVFNPIEEVI